VPILTESSWVGGPFRCSSICLSVVPLITSVYCGKMADSIEMPFRVVDELGPRNHVFYIIIVQIPTGRANCGENGAAQCNLHGLLKKHSGDAAFSQITFGFLFPMILLTIVANLLLGSTALYDCHPQKLYLSCRMTDLISFREAIPFFNLSIEHILEGVDRSCFDDVAQTPISKIHDSLA